MVTERTLKHWRRDALNELEYIKTKAIDPAEVSKLNEYQNRILRMTQELLDAHLIRSGQVSEDKKE